MAGSGPQPARGRWHARLALAQRDPPVSPTGRCGAGTARPRRSAARGMSVAGTPASSSASVVPAPGPRGLPVVDRVSREVQSYGPNRDFYRKNAAKDSHMSNRHRPAPPPRGRIVGTATRQPGLYPHTAGHANGSTSTLRLLRCPTLQWVVVRYAEPAVQNYERGVATCLGGLEVSGDAVPSLSVRASSRPSLVGSATSNMWRT
jgi:hypothetical protein